MTQYQFVTGISLAALQDEVNRIASEEPGLTLNQVLHVPGAGFVAVIERDMSAAMEPAELVESTKLAEPTKKIEPAKSKKTPPRWGRKR